MRGYWSMTNNRLMPWRKAKREISRGALTEPFSKSGGIARIHVWNELQVTPARLYGESKFGKGRFRVVVSKNADMARMKQGGICYHFA